MKHRLYAKKTKEVYSESDKRLLDDIKPHDV